MKTLSKIITFSIITLFLSHASFAQIDGFTVVCKEGASQNFKIPSDICYGANGKFYYKNQVTGTIKFDNKTFGDPIPGVVKKGYARPYTYIAKEGETVNFKVPSVVAYGINGKFFYRRGIFGKVTFTNAVFGDPVPGVAKKAYYKSYEKVAKEGESFYLKSKGDVGYGANGQFVIKKNVTGWIKFDNATFGDPAPGVVKSGYVNYM